MSDLRKAVARYFAGIGCGHRKAVCTEHVDCPFVLHAYNRQSTGKVTVTSLVTDHSLAFVQVDENRCRIPSRVSQKVTFPIVHAYMTMTSGRATATGMADHLRTSHQLKVSYNHAWRVRTAVLEAGVVRGKASYMLIENWLQRLREANPRTATRFERDADSRFYRACVVHGVFDQVFANSLPILALDACHLKTKDKGALYVASMITGNFDIFIAGIGIACREDNGDDWAWVLAAVTEAAPSILAETKLVVVSDRDKGLKPAVTSLPPCAFHSYCSVHIKRDIQARYHINLTREIHTLAKAPLSEDVTDWLENLHDIGPKITEYVIDTDLSVGDSAFSSTTLWHRDF